MGGTWLAQLQEHMTLGLRVVNSSPILGVVITLKNKQKTPQWEKKAAGNQRSYNYHVSVMEL